MILRAKVKCIHFLRRIGLIPDIWYESEIRLSKIESKELAEFFNKDAHNK